MTKSIVLKSRYAKAAGHQINDSNKYSKTLIFFVLVSMALLIAINSPAIAQDNKGTSPGPTTKPTSKPASKSKKTPGSKPAEKTVSKPAKKLSAYESYLLKQLGILDPAYAQKLRRKILEKRTGPNKGGILPLKKLRRKLKKERKIVTELDEKGFLDKNRKGKILIRLKNRAWILGKFKQLYYNDGPPKWFTDKRKKQEKKKAAKAKPKSRPASKPKSKAVPKITEPNNNTINTPKRKVFVPPGSFRMPKLSTPE